MCFLLCTAVLTRPDILFSSRIVWERDLHPQNGHLVVVRRPGSWLSLWTTVPLFVYAFAGFIWFLVGGGDWRHGMVAVLFAVSAALTAGVVYELRLTHRRQP